jgi:hypothetical protein
VLVSYCEYISGKRLYLKQEYNKTYMIE